MKTFTLASIVVATAFSLAGCGGGGDSTSTVAQPINTAPVPVLVIPAAPSNPDLVAVAAAATYAGGSVEAGAWKVLQAERSACGFGFLNQDTRLDAASASHSTFLTSLSVAQNVSWNGHGEDSTKPGFTGGNGLDRAVNKGFPNTASVTEILDSRTIQYSKSLPAQVSMNEAAGAESMRSLMGTVYHLGGALFEGRVGGVGASRGIGSNGSSALEFYRFGALTAVMDNNPQRLGSGAVANYPCADAKHVKSSFKPAEESPNPFPSISDKTVLVGTPIYLKADAGSVLVVATALVTKPDGSLVSVRQLTESTDAAKLLGRHEFFVVPDSPLVIGNTYTVNAAGTVDGKPFTKTFSFTPNF